MISEIKGRIIEKSQTEAYIEKEKDMKERLEKKMCDVWESNELT